MSAQAPFLVAYFDDLATAPVRILTDHIGFPLMAVDPSGTTLWDPLHEPYGELVGTFSKSADPGLRYPGQWQDEVELEASCVGDDCTMPGPLGGSLSLFENGYRWYRPAWGRYSQSDPLGLMGDAHMYAYAYQNPNNYLDPFGLKTCVIFVIDPWFMVGNTWIGGGYHHVALWMDKDCEGEQFLFDPSGSYQGPGNRNVRGSYGIFSGQAADLDSYKDYHTDGGTNGVIVETICFETDDCDQCSIAKRAWELGDPRGFFCSATTSECVAGIGPFDDFTSVWPKFFRRHLRKNPDGTSSHP